MTVRPPASIATPLAWGVAMLAVAGPIVAVLGSGDATWKALLTPVLFAVPGVLVATSQPRQPLGWLMLTVALLFGGVAFAESWAGGDHAAGVAWAAWYVDRGAAAVVPAITATLLLLPDGRLPTPGWRPVVRVVLAAQILLMASWSLISGPATAPDSELALDPVPANPLGLLPASWAEPVSDLEWLLTLPLLLVVPAVVVRLRRGAADERPRLVSVLAAVLVFVLLVVVGRAIWPDGGQLFDLLGSLLLTAALTSAVVRRRLPGVELTVSHALVYAVLTALIACVYVALVAAGARIGLPEAAVGLATAAVALALLPLRNLLQRVLTRAMYGDVRDSAAAMRRLAATVEGAGSLDSMLTGLAQSTAASLRAAHVQVEIDGHQASHGISASGAQLTAPLSSGDTTLGSMTVSFRRGRRCGEPERELLRQLASYGGRAIHAALLADELLASRQLLVSAREEERARLRRDLHDELGPTMASLAMQLGAVRTLLHDDPEAATRRLGELETSARSALEDVRRVSRELRPPLLDDLGLARALTQTARDVGLQPTVAADELSVPPAVEVAAYRIGTEALLNVARHAGTQVVVLELRANGRDLLLRVVDHGCGRSMTTSGVGTHAMRERAEELCGTLELRDTPGGGTTVEARFPLTPQGAA